MVGRKEEVSDLNRLYDGDKAEFIAVYGRRRVGKTYLIDQTFKGRITFRHVGLSPAGDGSKELLKQQLDAFYNSLVTQGMEKCDKPENWFDAFLLLEKFLQDKNDGNRQVVFFDELPWMDTPRSYFIRAFESFWNGWGCHRNNLMVIVSGSANSWIQNKLINNYGGLYGRLTYVIKLHPFNLFECEKLYEANGVSMSRYDIAQSYMIFGGIPYYIGFVKPSKSLAQNVDNLFFARNAVLKDEYEKLFSSMFNKPELVMNIVKLLSKRNSGYTRKEISTKLDLKDGDTLSKSLNALVSSDFVLDYVPFGCRKNDIHYKLIDPFCMFYLHFISGKKSINEDFWEQNATSPTVSSWRGFAFENACFNHVKQIKFALGISGVITESSAWSKRGDDEDGTQIDLLIKRNDNVINMCEIKYYSGDFKVNKDYYKKLLGRQTLLSESVPKKMVIHNTLITTFGLVKNEYNSIFKNVITLDDLFND